VTVRPAVADDLDALTQILLACWQQNYAGLLPAPTIAAMNEETAHALWEQALKARQSVDVLEHEGEVVGVVRYTLHEGSTGAPAGMIESLYVHPEAQGIGAGRTLLTHAVEQLRLAGAVTASLWVFEANAPARAFYQRVGWYPSDVTRTQDQFGAPEVAMRLTLVGP